MPRLRFRRVGSSDSVVSFFYNSAVLAVAVPFVEWWADNLPERRLGALGAGLVVTGFMLQSVQYWTVILNIAVR